MKKRLRKLVFWKFFNFQTRLILCLFGLILVTSSVFFYYFQGTVAYPFVEADEYKVLDDPRFAVEADFDGDGKLDLAVANFRSSFISISLNNGDGTFRDAVNFQSGGVGPLGLAAKDFDGDGKIDIAVVNYNTETIRILKNNTVAIGTPVFNLLGASYTAGVGTRPSAIVADKFDGDANWDLVVTNAGTANFSVFLGNGSGGFAEAPGSPFACGYEPKSVLSEDLNNDTFKDLIIINAGIPAGGAAGNKLSISFGNGDGTFSAPVFYNPPSNYYFISATAGNFDADADLELAAIAVNFNYSSPAPSQVRIFDNNGSGAFTITPNIYTTGQYSTGITTGDFNSDSSLDLAVTNFIDNVNNNSVAVLTGNNNLTFNAPSHFSVGRGPIYLLAADFDADAKDDIISVNKGENYAGWPGAEALPPGNNSFSYLRNFEGVRITQDDRTKFVSEDGITDSYEVVLTSVPTEDVTVTIAIDPAIPLDQISLDTYSLVFTTLNWNIPQTVTITAINDGVAEGEHFSLITHSASTSSGTTDFDGIKIPNINVQIADNDQPGVVIYETNGFTEVIENGITDAYQVVLEKQPCASCTVTVSVNLGLFNQVTVFPSSLNFTDLNWNIPQTVTVTAINDSYIEGSGTTLITHNYSSTDPGYNAPLLSIANVLVNVLDDDYLNQQPLCLGMTGDLVYNFQINGLDLNESREIALDRATQSFCNDLNYNSVGEATDGHLLTTYILSNYYEDAEVVIVESGGSTDVTEGGATDTYLVYLRRKPVTNVYVDVVTNSQLSLGIENFSYVPETSPIIFTNLDFAKPHTVTITAVDDFLIEGAHFGTISHTASSVDAHYSGLAVNSVTANITDNDTAGVVIIESGLTTLVSEAGTPLSDTVDIVLSALPTDDVIIDFTTPDGQTTVLPASMTFTSVNGTDPQTLTITVVDDLLYEANPHVGQIEAVTSSLDPNFDGLFGYINTDIEDNDSAPILSINDVSLPEGNAGITNFIFTVTLSAVSGMQTRVTYAVADGTATVANNDYTGFPTELLIIPAGDISRTITVAVNGDTVAEPNETFYINLTSPVNATLGDSQGLGTILDDDTAGITVSAISGPTTESGGTATFTVVLDRQPLGGPATTVIIALSSSDPSEGTVSPSSLTFTRLNWNIPQTVTVIGVDDDVVDGNISYFIITEPAVCATDDNFNGLNAPDVAVINLDNDGESYGSAGTVIAPGNVEPPCEAFEVIENDALVKAINWNFTDNSSDEDGFRLYEPRISSEVLIKEVAESDINKIQETEDLATNQAYTRIVKAYNNLGFSNPTEPATCYTLANIPKPLSIKEIGNETITVNLNPDDGNPPETKYAIRVISGTAINFVNPDGSFSLTETWHTYAEFGGDNGVVVTGAAPINVASVQMALTTDQNYSFGAKAKNGDDVETSYSASVDTLAMANLAITKGVGINLAKNYLGGLVRQAWAGNFLSNANSPLERILSVLSWLFNVVLIILMIILVISLQQTLKYLKHKIKYPQTAGLIWAILSKEAQYSYQNQAQPTEMGIYNKISYNWHKNLHNVSQGSLILALATVGLKLLVMGGLLFSLISLNHSSLAQTAPYNQSNQPIVEGDVLSYIITVTNDGTADAQDLIISDTLSSYLTYQSGSEGIDFDTNTKTLTFNISELKINESVNIIFKALVNSGAANQTITNEASVSAANAVPANSNMISNNVSAAVPVNENVNQPIEPPINDNTNIPPVIPPATNENINEPPVVPPAINDNTNEPPIVPPTINDNTNQPPAVPPASNENINQPPVIPGTTEPQTPIIGPIIDNIRETEPFKTINRMIFDNSKLEDISQNIITPLLITVAAVNTLPTLMMLTFYLLPWLHLLFLEPFLILFRKKREKWGVVYNSLTKMPLDLALVRLYKKDKNQLVQTRVTDKDGRYLLIVKEPGKYYLTVTRPGYLSPSRYLQDEKQDLKYLDLYHGEAIEVSKQGTVITANIPLDPLDKKAVSLNEVVRSYFLKNLRLIISYLGIILALVVVLIIPTAITIAALIIHILLFLLFRKFIVPPKPKSWGIVYDEKSKEPLSQAVVRIFDLKFNKLLETQVTDSNGRYSFLVGNNIYQLLTEKTGYQKKETKPVDLVKNEEIVNLDIEMAKQ